MREPEEDRDLSIEKQFFRRGFKFWTNSDRKKNQDFFVFVEDGQNGGFPEVKVVEPS